MISPINVVSPICFHLYRIENGNDDISSEEHFESSKISKRTYIYLEPLIFCPYIWILSRKSVPLMFIKCFVKSRIHLR
jgi:hypothetical protein